MSGRPRKHGWLIWEWFPRWDDNGLTHWWSQERCASCTRSQYGSFAKREGHARAQLQKTRLWCCRTPLHVCDCRGQTLNESMSESISDILFPRKRAFLFVCPVAFHGMKINNFTRPYQNSPDRKLTTQRILVCYHAVWDLIVFKNHNVVSFRTIRRNEMCMEQLENDWVCSFCLTFGLLVFSSVNTEMKWIAKVKKGKNQALEKT